MSATRQPTICRSFSSRTRRTASVGWAVNTGSIRSRGSSAASSSAPTPSRGQRGEHSRRLPGCGAVAAALVVAAAADAVHALGQVDRLEVGRERAHQVAGLIQLDVGERRGELVHRRVGLAARDRGAAQRLDLGEEVRPALLGKDLADQRAEHLHVSRSNASVGANSTTRNGSSSWSGRVPWTRAYNATVAL